MKIAKLLPSLTVIILKGGAFALLVEIGKTLFESLIRIKFVNVWLSFITAKLFFGRCVEVKDDLNLFEIATAVFVEEIS